MTDPSVPTQTVTLPSGAHLPLLGYGTWQLRGEDASTGTAEALAAGYRHIDTATMYGNEKQIGEALRGAGLPRESLFLTTKLPPDRFGSERRTLEDSLAALDVSYVDLWLIHWPPADGVGSDGWREFARAREEGLVRDIGVSNYSLDQLDRLVEETGTIPAVNQIEWRPSLFDPAVLDGHRARGVVLEGYSGLRHGMLDDPVVVDIAKRAERTPAQVIIRWHLQHGIVVIPKSAHPDRIRENADVASFRLAGEDMAALDRLGAG